MVLPLHTLEKRFSSGLGKVLIGVLIGSIISGGVSAVSGAVSTKAVTVCADKRTQILRYSKKGTCKKTETKMVLNSSGPAGAIGPAGSSFVEQSVCGSNGTTLCEVGVQGPGGGVIFFVDSAGAYADFDYLEAAPTDASSGIAWSATVSVCGADGVSDCKINYLEAKAEALKSSAIGAGAVASERIKFQMDRGSALASAYAAGVAGTYVTPTAQDWYLPSYEELSLMYANLKVPALLSFAPNTYWSSSELAGIPALGRAMYFLDGSPSGNTKASSCNVRAIRSF